MVAAGAGLAAIVAKLEDPETRQDYMIDPGPEPAGWTKVRAALNGLSS